MTYHELALAFCVAIAAAVVILFTNNLHTIQQQQRPQTPQSTVNYNTEKFVDLEHNIVCYKFVGGFGVAISCVKL